MGLERRFSNQSPDGPSGSGRLTPLLARTSNSRMSVIRDEFLEVLTRVETECRTRLAEIGAELDRHPAEYTSKYKLRPCIIWLEPGLRKLGEIRNAWIAAQTGA